ncbi:MAG: 30S ribosomal protein S1 [Ruminococcaceae bacterium]|nr:30S ribosomal protein S1 [Oscillospiraceae bacterium]
MNGQFLPEGLLIGTPDNKKILSSLPLIEKAMEQKTILEAKAYLCDDSYRLIFEAGAVCGIMEPEETAVVPEDQTVRDIAIISRVGKPVSFIVERIDYSTEKPTAYFSRKKAQELCLEKYLDKLEEGDVIDARVTHFEPFGCFCDIGCGIVSLLSIDRISVSRISHPKDRFRLGEYIHAAVKGRDEIILGTKGRISLTHRELLGTWSENAANFNVGETVTGIVRSIENYGIFIELAPNLAGLAEYKEDVEIGQSAAVYIKSIIPAKKKIKLVLIDTYFEENANIKKEYYITSGNVKDFDYYV